MRDVDASYAYCERVARREAKNFYYTFLFLPRPKRRSLHAVYTFSRRVDDAVDAVEEEDRSPDDARAELERLESFLGDSPPDDPLVPALRDTIARYEVPRRHFDELIAGMRMDLEIRRYATFEDLYTYLYRAASAVGLVCMEIFGHAGPEALEPAEHLGIAMQLTNILRDVAEDLDRDRIYLPGSDLERFGLAEEDLRSREADERFRALLRFEVERARDYFRRAEALYPLVDRDARYCPVLLGRMYTRVLDRIERSGYDVFSARARIPTWEKLALAVRTWASCRFGPRPAEPAARIGR